jgi:hypothetical protein
MTESYLSHQVTPNARGLRNGFAESANRGGMDLAFAHGQGAVRPCAVQISAQFD